MKFGEYWYLSGGCDNIFSQHFIIKSLKYTVRLKKFHSEPPTYTSAGFYSYYFTIFFTFIIYLFM